MSAIMEHVKRSAFAALDVLFARARAFDARAANPRRILILQLQQIGDSVIFTPTLRALRARFPRSEIHMLASPVAAQFYKKSPHVDRIHVATSWSTSRKGKRLRPLVPVLRALRRERFDCVIADIAQQSFKYSLIAYLTGAPLRVGFNRDHRGFLHTCQVPFRPDENWVECNLDLARAFGLVTTGSREEVGFDASDVERLRDQLRSAGHDERRRLIVLHTGSNWQSRTWYTDRWARLADTLREEHAADIIFVGGSSEKVYVEGIRSLMTGPSISLVGATDIPALAALASRLDLFVGTDSGPRHVTGAVGAPHVTLMCAQDDTDRWLGFRPGEVIMRSEPACRGCYFATCAHKVCMDAIELDAVLARCRALMAAPDPRATLPVLDRVALPPRLRPFVAGLTGKELRALAKVPAAASGNPD
jgi:ADP-heptose:LPS heptosyltransferase